MHDFLQKLIKICKIDEPCKLRPHVALFKTPLPQKLSPFTKSHNVNSMALSYILREKGVYCTYIWAIYGCQALHLIFWENFPNQ